MAGQGREGQGGDELGARGGQDGLDLAPGPNRPALVIGFAAETTDLEANARAKLSRKGCDWIVGNDVSDDVFGSDGNAVLLVTREGTESWPRQPKTAIARALAARIADHFHTDGKA